MNPEFKERIEALKEMAEHIPNGHSANSLEGMKEMLAEVQKIVQDKVKARVNFITQGNPDISWKPHVVTELTTFGWDLEEQLAEIEEALK